VLRPAPAQQVVHDGAVQRPVDDLHRPDHQGHRSGHELPMAEVGDDGKNTLPSGQGLLDVFEPLRVGPLVQGLPGDPGHLEQIGHHEGQVAVDALCDFLDFLEALSREGVPEVVQGDDALPHRGVVEEAEDGLEDRPAQPERDQPEGKEDKCRCARRFHELVSCS